MTFAFEPVPDLAEGQRHSTYWNVTKLCRGPQPLPDWVVTDHAAIDIELGLLKTGKEADCFLVERAVPGGRSSVLAAKRYRGHEHLQFHRSSDYTEGRRTQRSRDARALANKSSYGRTVAAGQWAAAEWTALCQLWEAGVPVPYPVQVDGTEILMELIEDDGEAAPRLAGTRPTPSRLDSWFTQLRDAMGVLARLGWAHGDLSPYNVLAAGDRLVIIDLPQVIDLVANPRGPELLLRDCHNMCTWFQRQGYACDEQELFGELLAQAW